MLEAIIPTYAFYWVYIALALLLVSYQSYAKRNSILVRDTGNTEFYKALGVGLMFIIFFGLRPISWNDMKDTQNYADIFNWIKDGEIPTFDDSLTSFKDPLWYKMLNTAARSPMNVSEWFLLLAAIYIIFNLIAIRRIFRGYEFTAFLFFATSFLFYSGGINAVRNACAYSILLFGLSLYSSERKTKYLWISLISIIALMFHGAMAILVAGMLGAATIVRRTRYAVAVWLAMIVIALIGGDNLTQYLANTIGGRAELYASCNNNPELMAAISKTGFRWDFLLFSMLPIAVGVYVTEIRKESDKFYQFLLNTYILANSIWIIFIYAYASNRFAMQSWSLYSYIIAYPLLKMNLWKSEVQSKITLAMLWFLFAVTVIL